MSISRIGRSGWLALSAIVLATLLGAPAAAAGSSSWYVAGRIGQVNVEGDFGQLPRAWLVDDDATAAGVEVGYLIHRHLGIQAGYVDLGTYVALDKPCPVGQICRFSVEGEPFVFDPDIHVAAPLEADFSGFSLAALPRWPVTERFALYGKVGVIDWLGEIAFSDSNDDGPLHRPSGQDFLGGVGALYAFPRGLGVQLEYETTDLFDQVSLGSVWRF